MITQSKSAAGAAAARDAVAASRPTGMRAHFNPLLVDISSRNAIKSAEAHLEPRGNAPSRACRKIVVWRSARSRQPASSCTLGSCAAANDASNTTLHACGLAPRRVQPSNGTQNHHRVPCGAWPCATRRRTTRRRALLPGVAEGAVHLNALQIGEDHLALTAPPVARLRDGQVARGARRLRRLAGHDAHGHRARHPRAARQAVRERLAGARGREHRQGPGRSRTPRPRVARASRPSPTTRAAR